MTLQKKFSCVPDKKNHPEDVKMPRRLNFMVILEKSLEMQQDYTCLKLLIKNYLMSWSVTEWILSLTTDQRAQSAWG